MKISLFLFLSFSSVSAFAQSRFFLEPQIGYGISNVYTNLPPAQKCMEDVGAGTKNIKSFNPQILVGYRFRKWEIMTGLDYLRTGFMEPYCNLSVINSETTEIYGHFVMPFTVTRVIPLGYRWSFYPTAGVECSYNYSIKFSDAVFPEADGYATDIHPAYKTINLWGTASANFGYAANQRLSIIAGPQMQYMMTSILNDNVFSQRNYAYTFNAGIRWNLKNPAKPSKN